jgi:hypothetical protein
MIAGRLSRGVEGYDEASFINIVTGQCVGLELQPKGLKH